MRGPARAPGQAQRRVRGLCLARAPSGFRRSWRRGGGASLLLLDCRPHELFESSHIETAINLAIPGLMLRRLRKGNLPIRSIIPNHADKERFATRCKAATVLLYDEATAEWQPEPGAPASVLGLLLQKLRDDGCQAYYLQGEGSTETPSCTRGSSAAPDAPAGGRFRSMRPACPIGATSPPAHIRPSREPCPSGLSWWGGGGPSAPLSGCDSRGVNKLFPFWAFLFNCCWRHGFQLSPSGGRGPSWDAPSKATGHPRPAPPAWNACP